MAGNGSGFPRLRLVPRCRWAEAQRAAYAEIGGHPVVMPARIDRAWERELVVAKQQQ